MVINKADKGGAAVLQNGGEYMKEDAQQLLTGMFYQILNSEAPKKDSCVRRSKKLGWVGQNISLFWNFFLSHMCRG